MSSFSSLSLISASWDGLLRRIVILSVTTEVSSPRMSLTETSGLSEMASRERDFQFLIDMEPEENRKRRARIPLPTVRQEWMPFETELIRMLAADTGAESARSQSVH
uniref:Uncharacterized protein n=1 Tax=Anopheles atroparvus TaxID=41427 RepID=A0A182J9G4_ANOAO